MTSNRETALAQNRIRYISASTPVCTASPAEYWRTARVPHTAQARGSTCGGHQFGSGSRNNSPVPATAAPISTATPSRVIGPGANTNATTNGKMLSYDVNLSMR